MRIVVTGSSGLIGSALTKRFRQGGHDVVRLVRTTPRPGEARWNPTQGTIDAAALEGCDGVVHLAGAGIGDRRWTAAYKQELVDSRVLGTTLLAKTIATLEQPPRALLSGSAIGFYGPHGDEELTETSPAGSGFLADLCVQWEQAADSAVQAGIRTVFLRTGIVLSPAGGALKKQLPLFRFGLGGKFGNGKPWQSWISLTDHVRAMEYLLTSDISGPVNLTAANPVTGAQFAKTLGKVLHRPAFLPVPAFGPRLLLGAELANALLFTGQRVLPSKLTASGFEFDHSTLEAALRHELKAND